MAKSSEFSSLVNLHPYSFTLMIITREGDLLSINAFPKVPVIWFQSIINAS